MNASLTTILLATDGSDDAALVGQAAADISHKVGAQLHVVHAGPAYRPRRIRPWCSTTTPARQKRSQPTLLAVGNRGMGAPKSMILGGVSTRVLRETEGPVLITPGGPRSSTATRRPTSDVGGA